MKLSKVKEINKAVLDHYQNGQGGVFCEVVREVNMRPFVYEVWRARTRNGGLQVKTMDGWKYPSCVYVQPIATE